MTMTTEVTKESILSQIDDLVSKSTFSLDALNAVNSLKETLQKLQKDYEDIKKVNVQFRDERDESRKQLDDTRAKLRECQTELKQYKERQVLADKAIYDAEKYKEVAGTWEKAMNIVFKPSQVRESIFGSTTDHGGNGISTSSTRNSNVVRDFE